MGLQCRHADSKKCDADNEYMYKYAITSTKLELLGREVMLVAACCGSTLVALCKSPLNGCTHGADVALMPGECCRWPHIHLGLRPHRSPSP